MGEEERGEREGSGTQKCGSGQILQKSIRTKDAIAG
jgi:hypothetical protein